MSLYQRSVINKYLKAIDKTKVNAAWEIFKAHFHNKDIQANIRNSKEEQYQGEFLIDLFVKVLGYTKNPTPNFNLTTELKNVKGAKKTDGAILKDGKALAVIELKGTKTTDLAKVENQAFGYKNNQPDCIYVITSNFEKLRFYIDNAVDFEEFNLFQLTREQFDLLWVCLSSDYLLQNIPQQIKAESLTKEEDITKKLYKDYSQFRNEIFDSIQELNPNYDKLTLFKKTQKLLDRFLFIFFAEDRLLVPPNSINQIIEKWKDDVAFGDTKPLYAIFRQYFNVLNTGRPASGKRAAIFAYNGGLFAEDEILDNILIDDELLSKHTQTLSNYDFESEVSVNILGHIFEHSLNEIEEIQAELAGVAVDKKKSKRKKDGVFYTPKYITKYIVDNTVGKLCKEKKTELGIDEADYEKDRKGRKKATLKALSQQLEDYRNWLLGLTICDPACGSGAFLNQALEFLITEHRYIDELTAKLLNESLVLSDVQNDILENNLFGVDINEESVEIAKLSLWLRTAKIGRKLTTLSDNIKCGNSLIDAPLVAGEKAFNWEKEFPQVFENGGFDVVIGNPPYGATLTGSEDSFYRNNFSVASYQIDTYSIFCERGNLLLKTKGRLGFIIPSAWVNSVYDKELREYLLTKTKLEEIIIAEKQAFADATVETLILVFNKSKPSNILNVVRWDLDNISYQINLEEITVKDNFNFPVYTNPDALKIVRKLKSLPNKFDNYLEIIWGVKVYKRGMGTPKQTGIESKEKKFHIEVKELESHLPLIGGKNIQRYSLEWSGGFLNYGEWIAEPRTADWFFTESPRIVVREVTSKGVIQAALLKSKMVFSNSVDGMRVRKQYENLSNFFLAVINSKLISFYHRNSSPNSFKDAFPKVLIKDLKQIPVVDIYENNILIPKISGLADLLSIKNIELTKVLGKLKRQIQRKFEIGKLSSKLNKWHLLTFNEFIAELIKKKIKLSLSDESEWEDFFDLEKTKAQALQNQIDQTDKQIDQMVYELYGLTAEEIKIVEDATA